MSRPHDIIQFLPQTPHSILNGSTQRVLLACSAASLFPTVLADALWTRSASNSGPSHVNDARQKPKPAKAAYQIKIHP